MSTKLDELQTVKRREAAKILSCSTRTVQRMEADGRLHGIKISPRATRYLLTDIQKLVGVN